MSDSTILLGIITLLNGVYVIQNFQQNRKLNKWIAKMEHWIEEFIVIKTEHKLNHGEHRKSE